MYPLLVLALVLNLLVEAMAAAALIGGPFGIAASGVPGPQRWSMHYGFAVLAIASAGVWLWPWRRERAALTPVLGILVIFHASVLTSLLVAGDQPEGVVLHATLAVLFAVAFAGRGRIATA